MLIGYSWLCTKALLLEVLRGIILVAQYDLGLNPGQLYAREVPFLLHCLSSPRKFSKCFSKQKNLLLSGPLEAQTQECLATLHMTLMNSMAGSHCCALPRVPRLRDEVPYPPNS